MMKLPQTTLVVPLSTGPKTSYKRNTKKPDSEKSILELFFDAQYDIQSGVQPPICIRNGILIEHLGQRVRAPTTWETIQDGINKKSDVHKRAQEIETGDFSDDEEDDELSSRQYPPSPRSNGHGHGHTPPPPSPHEEESQSHTFSTTTSPRTFAKPQPKGRKGTGKGKRRGKISLDERVDGSVSNTTNSFMNSHKSSESSYNNSNNSNSNNNNNGNNNPNKQYSKIPENSMSNHPNNNNNNSNSNYNGNGNSNNNNENSSNGVDTSTHKHKKLHSPRRRQKPQSHQSVHDLWFKAQRELAEGRQPRICKQNGVRLENVRIHVAKYANHAKRNSRVSPQDFLNTYNISKPRKSIAADDDEDEDLTADEGDPEFSNSKSINSSKK